MSKLFNGRYEEQIVDTIMSLKNRRELAIPSGTNEKYINSYTK